MRIVMPEDLPRLNPMQVAGHVLSGMTWNGYGNGHQMVMPAREKGDGSIVAWPPGP